MKFANSSQSRKTSSACMTALATTALAMSQRPACGGFRPPVLIHLPRRRVGRNPEVHQAHGSLPRSMASMIMRATMSSPNSELISI